MKKRYLPLIALVLCNQALSSCSTVDVSPSSSAKSELKINADASAYSDAEIFKAVMFCIGDFAKSVPSLQEKANAFDAMSDQDKAEANEKINELIAQISEQDPEFMHRFYDNILSKSPSRVHTAIKEGSLQLVEHIDVMIPGFNQKIKPMLDADKASGAWLTNGEPDQDKINSRVEAYKQVMIDNGQDPQLLCSWAVACVFYFAVAVHNTVAVTAAFAVALSVWAYIAFWVHVSAIQDSNTSLQMEMLVGEIAAAG